MMQVPCEVAVSVRDPAAAAPVPMTVAQPVPSKQKQAAPKVPVEVPVISAVGFDVQPATVCIPCGHCIFVVITFTPAAVCQVNIIII